MLIINEFIIMSVFLESYTRSSDTDLNCPGYGTREKFFMESVTSNTPNYENI